MNADLVRRVLLACFACRLCVVSSLGVPCSTYVLIGAAEAGGVMGSCFDSKVSSFDELEMLPESGGVEDVVLWFDVCGSCVVIRSISS